MSVISACPPPDKLLGFASGELSDDQSAQVEQHMDSCAECRAVLSNMARGGPPPAFGRYRIDTVLGSGGMGIVYRAYDPQLARPLAIKVVRRAGDDTQGRARLVREAQSLARLSHPNVCHVYDVGTEGEEVWLAMELIDGVSLRQWAGERRNRDEILQVLLGSADGIAAAHQAGLVHRDIKPENVLVTRDGRAIVTDFGLARHEDRIDPNASTMASDPHLTATGAIAGTPAYLAPEQLLGDPIDARVDQFAWATMAWELLTGSRPFPIVFAVRVEAIRAGIKPPADLPKSIYEPLMRAMKATPSERYPTMRELIEALRAPHKTVDTATTAQRRTNVPAVAGVAVLAAGAAAIGVFMLQRDRHAPAPPVAAIPTIEQPVTPPPPMPDAAVAIATQPQPPPPQPAVAATAPPKAAKTKQGKPPPAPQPEADHTTTARTIVPSAQPAGDETRDSQGHKYCRSCQVATADAFCFIPYDFEKPTVTYKHSIVDWGTVSKVEEEIGTWQDDKFKQKIITVRGQRRVYRFDDELTVGRVVTKVGALLAICEDGESDVYQFSGGPTDRMQSVITLSAPPNITTAAKNRARHIPDIQLAAVSLRQQFDSRDTRITPDGTYLIYAKPEAIDGPYWRMDRYLMEVPAGTPGENKLQPKKMQWLVVKSPEFIENPSDPAKKILVVKAVAVLDELFP
jgi:serine/threonine protein kinase